MMIVKRDTEEISSYLRDASNFPGTAESVFLPENYDELRDAVRECAGGNTPFTMSGGKTGLTGGCSPEGGAIISTQRMNRILSLKEEERLAVLEPGTVLRDFQDLLSEKDFFYPPDPTEWSSTIGGNVSTNASGARTFKYGATRRYVRSLKLILADGDEMSLRRGEVFADGNHLELRSDSGRKFSLDLPQIKMPQLKHAAGYFIEPGMDAIDLFIGSEGTLGVIGEIELSFNRKPGHIIGGLVFFDSEDRAFGFVEHIRSLSRRRWAGDESVRLESRLLEFFDKNSLALLRKKFTQIPAGALAAVWFEQEFTDEESEEVILNGWAELIPEFTGLADDTWLAMNEAEHLRIKEFRHALPSAVYESVASNKFQKVGTDIAVPDEHFREFYRFYMDEFARASIDYVIFGHIGNNHLHANLFPDSEEKFAEALAIYARCISKALSFGGTVSAEHGIGKIKKKYLAAMFGAGAIAAMKRLKAELDPQNLLGRGSVFD